MEKMPQPRSLKQNKAMHKYFQEVADLLNESGISMQAFVEKIEVDHTMESVKSLWRAIAKEKYNKTSTADFTTVELQAIFEECNRHIAQWGIHVDFPSFNNAEFDEDFLRGQGII